jgi:hypothetical protein
MMPTPPQEQVPTPPPSQKVPDHFFLLSNFGLTVLFVVVALMLNSEITAFEETGETLRMHVLLIMLYDLGGKNLVVGFLLFFAGIFFLGGVGEIVSLIRRKGQTR